MEHKISRRSYVLPAIQNEIYELLKAEKWCDASVKGFTNRNDISNAGISCHQVVLAMASPVIRHALQKAMDGSKQICCCEQQTAIKDGCFVFDGQIILAGASNKVVESLIPFIYGKSIPENIELKAEITGWLNALKIEDYRHDRGVDSETEVLDDDTSDEISEVCDTSVPIKHHCIACKKKSFKCNEEKLYIQHLSAHKTAMLEQLKESKRNSDSNKKFFCDMCQTMTIGQIFEIHINNCLNEISSVIESQVSNCRVQEISRLKTYEKKLHLQTKLNNILTAEEKISLPQAFKEYVYSCVNCKRRFKQKIALNQHSCQKIPTPWQYKFNKKSVAHVNKCLENNISESLNLPSHNLNDRSNSHEKDMISITHHMRNNDVTKSDIFKSNSQPEEKSSGLFCSKCKETFPTKVVQRLHSCKSSVEVNAIRTENIELFSSRSQRRVAQKINPKSPEIVKKIKILKTIGSDSISKQSNDSSVNSISVTDSVVNISLLETIQNSRKRNLAELENDDYQDFELSPKRSSESIDSPQKTYVNDNPNSNASSPKRLVIDLEVDSSATTRSPTPSPILEIVTDMIQDASVEGPTPGQKVVSTPKSTPVRLEVPQKDESVNCEQCEKLFQCQSDLTDHILEEHDSDPFD